MTREETIKKAQELLESGGLSKEAADAIKKDFHPKMALLKWFHFYGIGARTETLELPEDAI